MSRLLICISATAEAGDALLPRGQTVASAPRSGLALSGGSILEFAAPSARMGPPLTESPGRCRAFERGQAGSPFGGKHNRLRRETRVLSNGGIGSRHRVPAGCSVGRGALQGAPSDERWPSQGHALRERPRDRRIKGDGIAGSRSALQGQVTTATPFAPRWSGARRPSGNRS